MALFQVLLANLALLGMALAWGFGLMGLWSVFALLEYIALLLFALLMLEVLWR